MNSLHIIGNLTRDPESRSVGDKTVCNFTVAVNRRKTQQNQNPETDFFRVAAWGKMGENCQKYLAKGKKVAVTGNVSVHAYQDKEGKAQASMEVFAQDVEFLSSAGNGDEQSASQGAAPAETAEPTIDPSGATVVVTDDLPF